jgi:hypothetical protein
MKSKLETHLNLRLPIPLRRELEDAAEREARTASNLARKILADWARDRAEERAA